MRRLIPLTFWGIKGFVQSYLNIPPPPEKEEIKMWKDIDPKYGVWNEIFF
jgi:hypothetical protein